MWCAMNAIPKINPYLAGNFAPIASEDDFADLAITGRLPSELRGTLYRNGPNPQFAPRDANYHWFLGDGMLHAFQQLSTGTIWYGNCFVRTPKWGSERTKPATRCSGSWGNPMTTDPDYVSKGRQRRRQYQYCLARGKTPGA